ncbi:Heterocyst differentiation ATP-binding protein HepA [compost metagenome]
MLALLVISVVVVKATFVFSFGHFDSAAGNRVALNLRNAAYQKLQALSFSYYDKAKTGDLMSRLTVDLETLRNFACYELGHMFNFCASLFFGSAVMFTISW